MWVEDWAARAACKGDTPDALFVRGAEQNKAKQVCAGCPVRCSAGGVRCRHG